MSLVQKLNDGKIDVIGDIHGELEALNNVLFLLGYDENGAHKDERKLVFVGDFVDRGPDSIGVINKVKKLIQNGNAQAVLGNHELNLLNNSAKEGSAWYFQERIKQEFKYEPFNKVKNENERKEIFDFLNSLPIALERNDLRIVHATWSKEHIERIRNMKLGTVAENYKRLEDEIDVFIHQSGVFEKKMAERKQWGKEIFDENARVPFLENVAEYNYVHQMNNPIRVLTSGVERKRTTPFFSGGQWRFVERMPWWKEYTEQVPVIVGHFWRKIIEEESMDEERENIFNGISPFEWHGKNNNVFCVDYSVGSRFEARYHKKEVFENRKLGAYRWPENELILDTGEKFKIDFKHKAKKFSAQHHEKEIPVINLEQPKEITQTIKPVEKSTTIKRKINEKNYLNLKKNKF